MMKCKVVNIDITKHNLVLDSNNLFYLKLTLHGYTLFEIADFLEIELKDVFELRSCIEKKFNCSCWYNIFLKAFEYGILNQIDYVDDFIKKRALIYSEEIYLKLTSNYVNSKHVQYKIKQFLSSCDKKIDEETNKEILTPTQIRYIKYRFRGVLNQSIKDKLKLTSFDLNMLQVNIFKNLKVNNWYNAINKAFLFNILNRKEYLTVNIDKEVIELASKIISLKLIQTISEKEKTLIIYHDLLNLFLWIEFDYLSKANSE